MENISAHGLSEATQIYGKITVFPVLKLVQIVWIKKTMCMNTNTDMSKERSHYCFFFFFKSIETEGMH